jgi:transcription termination factor Rho
MAARRPARATERARADGGAGRSARRGRRGRRGGGGPNGNPQGQAGEERARGDVQVAERREPEVRREPREQRTDGRYGEQRPPARQGGEVREVEGMVVLEHASHGRLRSFEHSLMPHKNDVHISPRFVQQFQLRDGEIVKGTYGRGQGKNKYDLVEIQSIDGLDPREAKKLPHFKRLTSIDPDFHYAVGDGSRDTSLRIIDLICPIGRGQRGLIVAPPRSGKTILLQKFSHAIEEIYPEVELIVLLVDERPEEATEWKRTVQRGKVFVSTNDELHRNHVELCEAVWMYARHRVELGKDVILLMDSITRMGRAYNNVHGNSGKTMSGGLDTRALERPKQFFGSARNTETAGSLTILGTCLIETGSVMDKIIFEEFKGTGNMELVLSRKLADRRIFPAIDIEKSGTRKEEKLISAPRLKQITTLRRVLVRMHFTEAMELLVSKLDDVVKTDDFLKRFTIDPEA